jgi:hypothetical protein
MSDHKGARLVLDALPPAKALLADRGYDRNWFRDALCEPCIPPTKSRKMLRQRLAIAAATPNLIPMPAAYADPSKNSSRHRPAVEDRREDAAQAFPG